MKEESFRPFFDLLMMILVKPLDRESFCLTNSLIFNRFFYNHVCKTGPFAELDLSFGRDRRIRRGFRSKQFLNGSGWEGGFFSMEGRPTDVRG